LKRYFSNLVQPVLPLHHLVDVQNLQMAHEEVECVADCGTPVSRSSSEDKSQRTSVHVVEFKLDPAEVYIFEVDSSSMLPISLF